MIGRDVVEIRVTELREGVDVAQPPRHEAERAKVDSPLKLFFSYSSKALQFRDELDIHLDLLCNTG